MKDSDNPASFRAYLGQFPDGIFVPLARLKLAELEPKQAVALPPPPPASLNFRVVDRDEFRIATNNANVRAAPRVKSKKVGFLQAGRRVAVTGEAIVAGAIWYRVALTRSAMGYVFGPLLMEDRVAAVTPRRPPAPAPAPSPARPAAGVYPGAPKAGEAFKDCDDCPQMVVVPPGSFRMGSPSDERGRDDDEGPAHGVRIGHALAVGKYEVTFAEWDACASAGACNRQWPSDEGWGRDRRPVINVSWGDTRHYLAWLTRKTGHPYRLLSESEWEYVARAGTNAAFWWGIAVGRGNANCDGCGTRWDDRQTAPVGSFRANRFGLHDLLGNVWEWTADCWHNSYGGAPGDGSAWNSGGQCGHRVLRGGSWNGQPRVVRVANRDRYGTDYRFNNIGFRVARTIP